MAARLELPNINTLPESSLERGIVRSVEQLQLPPEKAVIVGSAALFLYGVKLPIAFGDISSGSNRIPAGALEGGFTALDEIETQPSDIDLAIDGTTHYELLESGQTPSGQAAILDHNPENSQDIFRVESQPLSIDLISRFNRSRLSLSAYDKGFRKNYIDKSGSTPIPGSHVRIATPSRLKRELKSARGEGKAYQDLQALRQRERGR